MKRIKQLIAVNPESVAVLTRKRIHSNTNIVDLWKSKEIELFAKAAYEWKFESRKKAYNDMSKASFGIVVDKYTDDYHMDRILRDYIDENNGNLDHRIFGIQVHNYYEMREIYGGKQMDEGRI